MATSDGYLPKTSRKGKITQNLCMLVLVYGGAMSRENVIRQFKKNNGIFIVKEITSILCCF